jgi:hypothetical protein
MGLQGFWKNAEFTFMFSHIHSLTYSSSKKNEKEPLLTPSRKGRE